MDKDKDVDNVLWEKILKSKSSYRLKYISFSFILFSLLECKWVKFEQVRFRISSAHTNSSGVELSSRADICILTRFDI
jgi:hypothetical protein